VSIAEAPAPGRREAAKQANRAAILAAALEVFGELGYGAASVRDIVRRTGLATGTFYNYFHDKESAFRAVVEAIAGEVRSRVQAARNSASTLEEFVSRGYRAYFAFIASEPVTFRFMRRNSGTIRTLFEDPVLGAIADELEADLRYAVAAGKAPAHDTRLMAAAMVGAGFEIGVRMLESDPPDVDSSVAFATALFLGAMDRLA
jgi:AcrR family transcriptional regulator